MPLRTADKPARASVLTIADMTTFLEEVFPEVVKPGGNIIVEDLSHAACTIRLRFTPDHLRPGGTISGPTMMMLADLSVYVAVLSVIGRVPLAVTSSLNINFFKKPPPRDLIAECRLLKIGRRLSVGEALILPDGDDAPVAHATATYAIPAT